jgi:formylmethanofuran dehydrogenase subunit D
MPSETISRGNARYELLIYLPTITWSTAALTNATSELTATVPGLQDGDVPYMMLANSAMPTGLSYTNIRVSAPNVLAVTWSATGTVTIPSGPWSIDVIRPEGTRTQLPSNAF